MGLVVNSIRELSAVVSDNTHEEDVAKSRKRLKLLDDDRELSGSVNKPLADMMSKSGLLLQLTLILTKTYERNKTVLVTFLSC